MALSLWHIILILVIILVPLTSAALAIRLNKTGTLNRIGFAARVGAFVIAIWLGGEAVELVSDQMSPARIAAGFALLTLGPALLAYWCVGRMRNAGIRNNRLALLSLIPLLGVFFVLYLVFARPEPAMVAATSN